jgi:RNA polymerase sigma factor (sigma-70 family)
MQKVWELYAIAVTIIEKLCKNKCQHLSFDVIDECNDYIKRRLENNEFQALKNYDPKHSKQAKASSYLHMLISSRLIDFFNSAKYQREFSSEDSINNSYHIEDEANDYSDILENVIDLLSFEEQTYIQYRYNDELSYKQIGDIFGITHKQASKKVENIQIKLRKKLEKTNYTLEDIL